MNNKVLKNIIVSMIIIIIIIIAIIMLLNKNQKQDEKENNIADLKEGIASESSQQTEKVSELVEKNDYNQFSMQALTKPALVNKYFEDYKNNAIDFPEDAYKHLDEQYKNKRFKNLEDYQEYLDNNRESIENMFLDKYLINEKDNYKEYICLDQKGNYYIFNVKDNMDYTVFLDTYTIESQEFLSKYNSGDDVKKAGMNVEKFFEALNTKDYVYVYEHLADSFKNNNYPTKESFEEYIKQNLFTFTGKEYINYNIQGSVHIFKLKVSNKEEESQQKNMTVMVKLKEKTDFEISFSIE